MELVTTLLCGTPGRMCKSEVVPSIRRYQTSDRSAVAAICLKTGNAGSDATGIHPSDDLLADTYALPYVDLEPEIAFVVAERDAVCGYLVATADTRGFVERYRSEIVPVLAEKYESLATQPGAHLVGVALDPDRMMIPEVDDYPAHMHIDLLPAVQGRGFGRMLIRALLADLRDRGIPGVHLGVGASNTGARAFYHRLGFRPLPSAGGSGSLLGLRTDSIV